MKSAMVVVLALMAGCSEYNPASIGDNTGNPHAGEEPDIVVSPPMLDFGKLSASNGETGYQLITIANIGDASLTIDSVSLDVDGSPFELGTIGSVLLAPGAATDLPVTFVPTTFDAVSAVVRVDSNDPDTPTVNVDLLGSAAAPEIIVDPQLYDFGSMPVGCDSGLTVTVSNEGDEDLVVDDVRLVAISDVMDVAVSGLPWTLPPEGSQTFDISYIPLDDLADEVLVEVLSNDPERPSVVTTLTGTPTPVPEQIDHFIQGGIWDQVDIMITLSEYFTCPSSMEEELHQLMDAAEEILDGLNDLEVDYQIMVNTAVNGCHNGQIVRPDTPNQVVALQDAIYGHSLSPDALEVALSALEMTGVGQCNEGFLREESLVKIISVADSDDMSNMTVEDYADGMKALAPNMLYSSVSGKPPKACSPDAFPGVRFEEATELMFGVQEDICDEYWTDHVVNIVHDFTGGIGAPELGSFVLTQQPIVDTIVVRVDLVENNDWSYDATSNSVVFDPDAWPDKLAEIDVEYDVVTNCEQ